MAKISRLALIGFGPTARSMLELGLNRDHRIITAYDPSTLNSSKRIQLLEQYIHYNVQGCISISDAVHSAHLIFLLDGEQTNEYLPSELAACLVAGQIILDLRNIPHDNKLSLVPFIDQRGATHLSGQIQYVDNQISHDHCIYSDQAEQIRQIFKSLGLRQDLIKSKTLVS